MATRDRWGGVDGPGLSNRRAVLVSLNDSVPLEEQPKFLRIGYASGVSGPARSDLSVVYEDGSTEVLSVVPGQEVHCRPVLIKSTGSTSGVVVYACT